VGNTTAHNRESTLGLEGGLKVRLLTETKSHIGL